MMMRMATQPAVRTSNSYSYQSSSSTNSYESSRVRLICRMGSMPVFVLLREFQEKKKWTRSRPC
jgi:hypothetical protein